MGQKKRERKGPKALPFSSSSCSFPAKEWEYALRPSVILALILPGSQDWDLKALKAHLSLSEGILKCALPLKSRAFSTLRKRSRNYGEYVFIACHIPEMRTKQEHVRG